MTITALNHRLKQEESWRLEASQIYTRRPHAIFVNQPSVHSIWFYLHGIPLNLSWVHFLRFEGFPPGRSSEACATRELN